MTFTGMSAGHPDGVSAFPEGRQDKFRTQTACTWYSYDPGIGRILHSADTGKISSTIAAPIAQKSNDLRIIVLCHYGTLLILLHSAQIFVPVSDLCQSP